MYSYTERGKKGSRILWNKYRTNKRLYEKVVKKWRKSRIENYNKSLTYKPKMVKKKIDILKSRLCGFLIGDGSVFIKTDKNGKKHHSLNFFPDHISIAELFKNTFAELYGRELKINHLHNHYVIQVTHKQACLDLLSITSFGSTKWKLPVKLFTSDKAKIECLRALFDTDGYVAKRYIQIQSVNKSGIKDVQKLLDEFGIKSKIYVYERKQKNWNANYLLNIFKIEMRKRFFKLIGFNHVIKKNKLENIIKAGVA